MSRLKRLRALEISGSAKSAGSDSDSSSSSEASVPSQAIQDSTVQVSLPVP
ncbi:unnamed protein product [Gongylonema pulchrum]|uniref:KID domain-containing protein n=1 Tax=Gongylonema pulchrum TaxID=637853 RepID=A0A183F1M2_9BILA|nr:unnamed protein product [Gongylonema pulchrum]